MTTWNRFAIFCVLKFFETLYFLTIKKIILFVMITLSIFTINLFLSHIINFSKIRYIKFLSIIEWKWKPSQNLPDQQIFWWSFSLNRRNLTQIFFCNFIVLKCFQQISLPNWFFWLYFLFVYFPPFIFLLIRLYFFFTFLDVCTQKIGYGGLQV